MLLDKKAIEPRGFLDGAVSRHLLGRRLMSDYSSPLRDLDTLTWGDFRCIKGAERKDEGEMPDPWIEGVWGRAGQRRSLAEV